MALAILLSGPASAWADGEVGIFPVRSQSLSPLEGAVIADAFADAYARASGQQIVYPGDTEPFVQRADSLSQAARALALWQYIDLTTVSLHSKLVVIASLHQQDGTLIHRARTEVPNVAAFPREAPALAAALVAREGPAAPPPAATQANEATPTEPAKPSGAVQGGAAPAEPGASPQPSAPSLDERPPQPPPPVVRVDYDDKGKEDPGSGPPLFEEMTFGVKTQVVAMVALGQAFDPMVGAQFTARLEGARYFVEFGAGLIVPTAAWNDPGLNIRRMGGITTELGASYYFFKDSMALYLGGGLMPRIMGGNGEDFGVRLPVYAQLGMEFLRHVRTRLFIDVRVAQNTIPYLFYSRSAGRLLEYYPTEAALQFGLGW